MRASIVVPTRDRLSYLSRCLGALVEQTLPPADYEIVVVDDGSSAPVDAELHPRWPGRVTVIHCETSAGPAEARNAGVRAARGDIVAFTDDDCIPTRGWLEAGCLAIERGLDIVTGRTIPELEERAAAGSFAYTMDVPGPDPRFSTCNCFYRGEVLRAAGGFRGAFYSSAGYHFGEDTDLAWRAVEAGARAGFARDAVVYHAVRPQSFLEHLRSRRRLENLVPLVKRYPGVKAGHPAKYLYSWSHLFAYLAAVGLLLAVVDLRGLLLVLPYALWRSREKRRMLAAPGAFLRRNRALPQHLIADLYECWVLARASFRHRHVFL